MTQLPSEKDFFWYKKALDVQYKTSYYHENEPKEYPCMVSTLYEEDNQSRSIAVHSFFYRQRVKCDKCGHVKLVWPEVES